MHRNSARGSPSMTQRAGSSQFMEQENNELTEKLLGKTAVLKDLSIQIGDEVRSQNKLLNEMDTDFEGSRSLLSATMKRLGIVSKSGGHRFLCYLVLFSLAVFLIIYYLISR